VKQRFGVGSGAGLRNAVAKILDRADQIADFGTDRVVIDSRGGGRKVHMSTLHPGSGCERSFNRASARRTRHARERQVHSFGHSGGGAHAATSYPSSRTAWASTSGFTKSVSYSTVARVDARSTVAFVTPGVEASLRSTPRAQLPHVMPRTVRFSVS